MSEREGILKNRNYQLTKVSEDAKIEIAKVDPKIETPDYDACSYFLIFLGWIFSIVIFPIFLFGGIKVVRFRVPMLNQ